MAARVLVGLRVHQGALDDVDKIMEQTGAKQAVVLRTLLGEALNNTIVRERAIKRLLAMQETA